VDTKTLLERYAAGERDFSQIDLNQELHLEDADLSGINLTGAMLYRAKLKNVNLEAAILDGVRLDNANLEMQLGKCQLNQGKLRREQFSQH
jgi:uncharacterized protein YjbI with pentapeptide repeats